MAKILKCKICGGDIELSSDKTIGTCMYCGCTVTFPKVTDEQRIAAFNRGNYFRKLGDFDKALSVYEQIIKEDDTDAEAHWCAAISRFGIEYVEDPISTEYIPTCHRASFESFLDDIDYQAAVNNSEDITQKQYIREGNRIDEIQKAILATSSKESPFDVFICYKESDKNGQRTQESVLAQEIYYALTEKGYKVFFSRITLEDKVGTEFEPYIFAALNSANVMVVVGTSKNNLDSIWVKNEWSRFIALMKKDRKKVLLPCYKDMDPYDMPEALAVLQSYNMASIGFMQDLIRGIEKIINPTVTQRSDSGFDIDTLKKRICLFLENAEFNNAKEYCDKILDVRPEDTETYILKLCAELSIKNRSQLENAKVSFEKNTSYQNALRFGTPNEKAELEAALNKVNERNLQLKISKKKKMVLYARNLIIAFVCIFIVFCLILNHRIKKAEQLAEDGQFQAANEHLPNIKLVKLLNPMLVSYIEAGVDYSNEEYSKASEILENMTEYKNAEQLKNNCEYEMLVENLLDESLSEEKLQYALSKLYDLKGKGVEDRYNLKKQIYELKNKKHILKLFENKSYSACEPYIDSWKKEYPESLNAFVKENREIWYKDMIDYIDSIPDMKSKDISKAFVNIESLINIIGTDYKDVRIYNEIIRASLYEYRIDAILERASTNKLASIIAWRDYANWFVGEWKTSDKKYYFTLVDVQGDKNGDGYTYRTSYNLPYFDAPNTVFDIDLNGVYYLHDEKDTTDPPVSRKDMYKFDIISKDQLTVYCYKDNNTYTIYRQ
ncbi:TIR domain-containing protein [Oribacterium sp. FC2011]|uniref:TIR domain-containing protein n=1 Tax=Oribacterium sp. FC2011 TaxID=1408311 RepID=UPI0004E1F035|nr:TIR domain-containing protein [Oribacterium sp. FC2011]